MPGSTSASAMALADMTESPIAVTSRPETGCVAGSLAAEPWLGVDACARVAAPIRSPVMICFSMPDGGAARKTPQPAVTPAPATARTAAVAAAACFVVNSLVFLPLTAVFSPRGRERKRGLREWGEGAIRHPYPVGPGPAVTPANPRCEPRRPAHRAGRGRPLNPLPRCRPAGTISA